MVMVTTDESKSFSTIKNTCPGITVQKFDCVGHVQKRVGCRFVCKI